MFLQENSTNASFCAHRANSTQAWIRDSQCQLLLIESAVACNCTVIEEVTLFIAERNLQENSSDTENHDQSEVKNILLLIVKSSITLIVAIVLSISTVILITAIIFLVLFLKKPSNSKSKDVDLLELSD